MGYPEWLDREEYPFEPNYFETRAGNIHYVDEGRGAPVVFVHGNPSWSFEYREPILALSEEHRCIAPDHIGFGLSDKPPGWSYLPRDHARNFEELMDSLDLEGITMVVGDWGGPIGLSYAIAHPERMKGLVLTNTWLWPANRDPHFIAFSSLMGGPLGRLLIKRYNLFAGFFMKTLFADKSRLTPEIHSQYTAPLGTPGERKGSWTFPRQIIGSTEWLRELWAGRDELQGNDVALVWGMKDAAFREKELARWRELFPDSSVTRFEDAGHFVAEEKPAELTREITELLGG